MLAALDRKIRWMALLYCTNTQHAAIIREAYGKDASTDSYEWIVARTKVFENIKSYKNKTIGRMLVCT